MLLSLTEAITRKYGRLDTRTGSNGYTVLAGRAKSISASPWLQPWCGFAMRDGSVRVWPEEDIDIWCQVFDHNREQYLADLLEDERSLVRDGVRTQLAALQHRKTLPNYARDLFENIAQREGLHVG